MNSLAASKLNYTANDADYRAYIQFGFHLLENFNKYYYESDLEKKEKLLGSIFPNRLIYENGKYRTNGRDNIICLLSDSFTESGEIKTGNTAI